MMVDGWWAVVFCVFAMVVVVTVVMDNKVYQMPFSTYETHVAF